MVSLVRVWTDCGAKKPVKLIAKLVSETKKCIKISYLSPGPDAVHTYEDDIYEIDQSSIAERLVDKTEEDMGYIRVSGGWVLEEEEVDPEYEEEEEEEEEEEDEEEDNESCPDSDYSTDSLD